MSLTYSIFPKFSLNKKMVFSHGWVGGVVVVLILLYKLYLILLLCRFSVCLGSFPERVLVLYLILLLLSFSVCLVSFSQREGLGQTLGKKVILPNKNFIFVRNTPVASKIHYTYLNAFRSYKIKYYNLHPP